MLIVYGYESIPGSRPMRRNIIPAFRDRTEPARDNPHPVLKSIFSVSSASGFTFIAYMIIPLVLKTPAKKETKIYVFKSVHPRKLRKI